MAIIIPSKVNPLILSYPDFTLGSIINPDEFDQNNLDIQDKLNEFIATINTTIDNTVEIETIVNDANTKSDDAILIANGAVTTADNAVTTANDAVAIANTADGKADNAVSTANTASDNATIALDKATQVETDYTAIVPIINQAVADVNQAVSDVADKADVSYVDQVAANFAMGVITDGSLLREKLDANVISELDGLRTDIDNTTSDVVTATNDIVLIKSDIDTIDNSVTFLTEQVNDIFDSLTLNQLSWVASGDATYPFKIEKIDAYFLNTMTPIVTFTRDSIEKATEAGIIVECTDGVQTFLAKEIPLVDLYYSIVYVKGVVL